MHIEYQYPTLLIPTSSSSNIQCHGIKDGKEWSDPAQEVGVEIIVGPWNCSACVQILVLPQLSM